MVRPMDKHPIWRLDRGYDVVQSQIVFPRRFSCDSSAPRRASRQSRKGAQIILSFKKCTHFLFVRTNPACNSGGRINPYLTQQLPSHSVAGLRGRSIRAHHPTMTFFPAHPSAFSTLHLMLGTLPRHGLPPLAAADSLVSPSSLSSFAALSTAGDHATATAASSVASLSMSLSMSTPSSTDRVFEAVAPNPAVLAAMGSVVLLCVAAGYVWANDVVPVSRTKLAISKSRGGEFLAIVSLFE